MRPAGRPSTRRKGWAAAAAFGSHPCMWLPTFGTPNLTPSPPHAETCAARRADPALAAELGQPLERAMAFFGTAQQTYGPLLLGALSKATG